MGVLSRQCEWCECWCGWRWVSIGGGCIRDFTNAGVVVAERTIGFGYTRADAAMAVTTRARSSMNPGKIVLSTSKMLRRGLSVMLLNCATRPTDARLRLMLRPEITHEVSRLALVLAQMVDGRALPRRWPANNELAASIQLALKWSMRGEEKVENVEECNIFLRATRADAALITCAGGLAAPRGNSLTGAKCGR